MEEATYKVVALITALMDSSIGWYYKDNEDYYFGGEGIRVESSNIQFHDSEIIGKIKENEFISEDGKYIGVIKHRVGVINAVAINCKDGVVIIPEESIFYLEDKRIEGYWYSEREPKYPMPIPNQLEQKEAEEIFKLIKEKEAECEIIYTRGSSLSRIDKSRVGSTEYQHEKWLWPENFAEHYVLKYKIKPSGEFLKFIGWRE